MYDDLIRTNYPPQKKPLMVFDGNCGFCKYWIIKWKKLTKDSIDYAPFQKVSNQFKDISEDYFATAVRLILLDGSIVSGPAAAYYSNKDRFVFSKLYSWYIQNTFFRKLSNILYKWVADNRSFMYKLSVKLFGKNPRIIKHYWLFYLVGAILIIAGLANI